MKLKIIILLALMLSACREKPFRDRFDQKPYEGKTELQIALVKMEDNGASGEKIGCGDSIVFTKKEAEGKGLEDSRKIQLALKELFAYGVTKVEDEFYNGLQHSSELKVDSVGVNEIPGKKTIEVRLSGQLISAGTCDDPRITEQITSTVEANSSADEILIYINDKLLKDYFDMSGAA